MPGEREHIEADQPLPEHLAWLASKRSTGSLVATSGSVQREILVVDGEIRAARSTSENEKLGLWLVDRERISEQDRALTLLSQGGSEAPPLGHLLVTRGCLTQAELESELETLALTIIERAAADPGTSCGFLERTESDQPDTLPNLTTSQIILIAGRAFASMDAKLAALDPLEQMVWPSSMLDALLVDLDLTPREAFLLSRLDGVRSVNNLISISSLPREDAVSTIYTLWAAGVVEIGIAPKHPVPAYRPRLSAHDEPEPPRVQVSEETLSVAEAEERAQIRQMARRASMVDHYRALGLEPGADTTSIERAWERIQVRCNPERSEEPHLADLEAELSTIIERARAAFDLLSKGASRRRYDEILASIQDEAGLEGKARDERRKMSEKAREELVNANFRRADELIREGEPYLAIRLLEQACALDPRPAELVKLARLLLRNPLWINRSLDALRRAVERDPKHVDAWLELAEIWRRRNHVERQRKALERALAADSKNEKARAMYRQLVGRRELDRLLKRARRQAI
jgi:curved DNA-binding protein CbpA